jgi:hypothetical protein
MPSSGGVVAQSRLASCVGGSMAIAMWAIREAEAATAEAAVERSPGP